MSGTGAMTWFIFVGNQAESSSHVVDPRAV